MDHMERRQNEELMEARRLRRQEQKRKLLMRQRVLAAGLLVNQHYQIWDYRGRPGNFLGQICPAFTLLWIPVALMAMGLYRWLDWRLDRMLGV